MTVRTSILRDVALGGILLLAAPGCEDSGTGTGATDSGTGGSGAGTGGSGAGTGGSGAGTGGSGAGAATEVTPSVDLNACSVLSATDVGELGLTEFRRAGSAVGFDEGTLDFFPGCHWTFESRFIKVDVEPADNYLAGADTADVGDDGHFDSNIAGDPELVFVGGELMYTLVTDGVGDAATDQAELLDLAARILENEGAQTGLFDDLSTAERAGGPAVYPCDLIEAGTVAADAGLSAFVVYPSQGGYFDSVQCHVSGGALQQETIQFAAADLPCTGDDVEIGTRSACFGDGAAGIGKQLSVAMDGYRLVVTTLEDAPLDAIETRLRALAGSIIDQL